MMESHPSVHLTDKYICTSGEVFMNGTQALVRLPIVQMRRDRAQGLNTAGFISGYRGSPLGAYDLHLAKAKSQLQQHNIIFRPGVNEDLAATAVWGSQQLHLSKGAQYDGVLGIWYGKGPGVDRSGDVLKHANAAGTSKFGGVLCLAGDDHGAKSSSIPHQSDHDFMSAIIPMLYPSSIHEFIELGLLGIAMSRYSGCWVGMKVISDTVETTSSVKISGEDRQFLIPSDFELPKGGLSLRAADDRWTQDERMQNHKPYAALAFARLNHVNQVTLESQNARLGIVASGKAYEDVRQALRELEITQEVAHDLGLRLYKVRMPWPLEPEGIRSFSLGLEEVLIIEERREIIENQIKQQLFNWRADVRPRIIGKFDHNDNPVLSLNEELSVSRVARVIADRMLHFDMSEDLRKKIKSKLQWLEERADFKQHYVAPLDRLPYFCSGCPHNTSTRVPDGSRAMAGIGCHFMAQWMDRKTSLTTHMGAEGVSWTGTAPFTDEGHVFVNLGDGTYFHSGSLAIRQAVASGVNLTYKILYNDAVAMTGGQEVDGDLSPQKITQQLYHEGVTPIYLLSNEPNLYPSADLAPQVIVKHRDDIDEVMKLLRESMGCSAMVYVQTCAAELRRKRKRKLLEDPAKRVIINPLVCEGCGDCSDQSNCISIEPLETVYGRKRRINQSNCNKDFSCVKGFCPSFVTVHGGSLRKKSNRLDANLVDLPLPAKNITLDHPYNIVITGIGGTGVLTIGAIIGMAAHIDGKASMILDVSGLAQKGGAVISHVRLSMLASNITSPRIVSGRADLLLAADSVVASSKDSIALCSNEFTHAIVNSHLAPVAGFVTNRDFDFKHDEVESAISENVRDSATFEPFTEIAEKIIGDEIATNIVILGYAFQKGMLPLELDSILHAIELNGVQIPMNETAFYYGRLLVDSPASIKNSLELEDETKTLDQMSIDDVIDHRSELLAAYQNKKLAKKYQSNINLIRQKSIDESLEPLLLRSVALNYAKLLTYKDEYEVARLYTNGEFEKQINDQFDGEYSIEFNLAPPILSPRDHNGKPTKRTFGPWMLRMFKILPYFKVLRGTMLDVFFYSDDRRQERMLIKQYEELIQLITPRLNAGNQHTAIELFSLPDQVRGFGHIKLKSVEEMNVKRKLLLNEFSKFHKNQ